MTDTPKSLLALLASTSLVTAAFAGEPTSIFATNFVKVSKTEINGKPARMIFMSSLSVTLLLEEGAKRLGLKGGEASEPAPVTAGGQTFTASIPIIQNPLKEIPWHLRVLANMTHPFLYHQFKNLFKDVNSGIEGVFGWPEIHSNILVFDDDRREIRRIEELPPETAGWLKLRIVPARYLLLELPLGNGKTNGICIDTADNRSVIVPGPLWNDWRAAHPRAVLKSRKAIGLPWFVTTHHEAFADEINLGPITLTNVGIEDMDGPVMASEMPNAQFIWALGINALSRMDLVIDGQNGWAYLHAKAAPLSKEPSPSAVKNNFLRAAAQWTVADNVRLSQDYFFVYSGEGKWGRNDLSHAEADFNRALEIDPRNIDARCNRGVLKEIRGDFAGAISDYDEAIQLKPDYSQAERLYRHSLLWRLETAQPEENPKPPNTVNKNSKDAVELNSVVVYGSPPDGVAGCYAGWSKTIGQFLVGKISEKEFVAAAKKSGDDEKKARAWYYIGMKHLSQGDTIAARQWFQKCRASGIEDNECRFAEAELKRLDQHSTLHSPN